MNTSLPTGKILVFLAATLCFCAIIIAGISISITNNHRIIYGVMAENSKLEGMSEKEAVAFFENAGKRKLTNKNIQLTYGSKSWSISPEEIHMVADAEKAAKAAYAVGRSGKDRFQNFLQQAKCAKEGYFVEMDASYDEALLLAKLEAIAAEIYTEPVNAYCYLDGDGSIRQIAGIVGKKLDAKTLCDMLAPSLKKFDMPTMELHPEEQQPFIRTEDIANINSVLASYTTSYSPGDRGDNIALAAEQLDGVLIKSGNVFSFNDTVGERTYSAGYKNAGVIIEGRLEDGVGGGVCQVSSTLYNAVLLAGLAPTARTAHSFPSSYCPPGRDATVADGLLDLQFQNQLPHSVCLVASAYGSELTIYVLGTLADLGGNTITLETEGSRMEPTVYRVYTRDGEVVEREYLHTDDYSEPVTAEPRDTNL